MYLILKPMYPNHSAVQLLLAQQFLKNIEIMGKKFVCFPLLTGYWATFSSPVHLGQIHANQVVVLLFC